MTEDRQGGELRALFERLARERRPPTDDEKSRVQQLLDERKALDAQRRKGRHD